MKLTFCSEGTKFCLLPLQQIISKVILSPVKMHYNFQHCEDPIISNVFVMHGSLYNTIHYSAILLTSVCKLEIEFSGVHHAVY